jgi:hypothetical protein
MELNRLPLFPAAQTVPFVTKNNVCIEHLQSTPEYTRSGPKTRMIVVSARCGMKKRVDATLSYLRHGQENTLLVLQQLLSRLEQPSQGEPLVSALPNRVPAAAASDSLAGTDSFHGAGTSHSP